MAIVLNFEDVSKWMVEAVLEKGPDYIYVNSQGFKVVPDHPNSCEYVHETSKGLVPGCIVGNVLAKACVSLSDMENCGSTADQLIDNFVRSGSMEEPGVKIRTFLQVAQICQDGGMTWGKAQHAALRAVKNL